MATRAELRSRVRTRLEDAGASALWPDAELDDYLGEGYREVGRVAPVAATEAIATVAGQTGYTLTGTVRRVLGVLLNGAILPQVSPAEVGATGAAQCWAFTPPATLTLNHAAGADQALSVRVLRAPAFPAADGDASGLDAAAEDLAVWAAVVLALDRRLVADGKRREGGRLGEAHRSARARREEARRRCQRARVG